MTQAREQNTSPSLWESVTVSIYPACGHEHSSSDNLSALAAYTRSLLSAFPECVRSRHVVLSDIKEGQPADNFSDRGFSVCEVWEKGSLLYPWQIFNMVRKHPSIKVVHLQHEFNQFGGVFSVPFIPILLWMLRLVLRKKIVVTFHEVLGKEMLTSENVSKFLLPVSGPLGCFLFRCYYRVTSAACHMVLVQHEAIRDRLVHEIGVRREVRILPIGTETGIKLADRVESRQSMGYQEQDRVLLFFGTLDWRKGLDILLDAFENLRDDRYHLLLGGGQPVRIRHRPEYQEWFSTIQSRIDGHPRIRSLGFVEDLQIAPMFSATDLVVLPYVVPQLVSAVMNHAASYERPFIASTAFSGHADRLVLFEANAEAIKEKIIWAFDHIGELQQYARVYKNDKSWTKSAALLSKIYSDIQYPQKNLRSNLRNKE